MHHTLWAFLPDILHCTWLVCIRSWMEDPSHKFLISRWFVHSWFMDLSDPFDAIVYYLLIGGMTSLDNRDKVPMVSTLLCIVTHYIGPMVSHDTRLFSSHNFTKLLYYIVSQLWEHIKLVTKLVVTLIYRWDP